MAESPQKKSKMLDVACKFWVIIHGVEKKSSFDQINFACLKFCIYWVMTDDSWDNDVSTGIYIMKELFLNLIAVFILNLYRN